MVNLFGEIELNGVFISICVTRTVFPMDDLQKGEFFDLQLLGMRQ